MAFHRLPLLVVAGGTALLAWSAPPALAACAAGAQPAGSNLPATGAASLLPALGLVMIVAALLVHHRRAAIIGLLILGMCLAVAAPAPQATAGPRCPAVPAAPLSTYLVGAAEESINPTPALLATKRIFLGGYGLSNGEVVGVPGPLIKGRYATGILGEGIYSRALAVSDGSKAIVTAQIETQGYFAAYKQGPYGIEDIRRTAAAAIAKARPSGPAIGPGQILINSNHSHSSPDTPGVIGGVPEAYFQLIKDRTVRAILRAYTSMVPSHLSYGTAKGGVLGKDRDALIRNQFSKDPQNQSVDDELRVLQAKDVKTGKVVVTYLNFSAHTVVLQEDNRLISADYATPLSRSLATFGGIGFHQVGTLGRTAPAFTDCADKALKGTAASLCTLNGYAGRVFARAKQAIATAKPLTGKAVVDLHSYLIQDVATNAPIFALATGGFLVGAPIQRQTTPPWFTGNVIGTTSWSGRIGDILISGNPGEPYPQIPLAVRSAVPGMRGYLSIGTAGDFLGYLIAPFEAYPDPIRQSILSGAPPPAGDTCGGVPSPIGCPSPINEDNYFFNPSMTIGERLICSLLRGAGEVTGKGLTYHTGRGRCVLFANDLLNAPDADTTYDTGPYRPVG